MADIKKTRVSNVRKAGDNHQVITVTGGSPHSYRRKPCSTCPWRVDAVGEFPAEAFRHSADTAYDMAGHEFACHQSGSGKPATCAGYLLRGAHNNLSTRIKIMSGRVDLKKVTDGGLELFESYREMAEANGVPPSDPCLQACR